MAEDSEALKSALARLERLHPKKIDLGLARIERVLAALGSPHHALPPVVHIAGTNGKGSTAAFIRAMAEAEGLRVHAYSSPHLVSFRERIVLAGELIGEDKLLDMLGRVEAANDGEPLSFFEATTAAAFTAFHETPADLLILEVGLGGRFDATNVIAHPALSVITPIDYDHAEFLGRDLAQIAREKAGILKRHCPAITARQRSVVAAVLRDEAARAGANLSAVDEEFHAFAQHGRLIFESGNALLDLPLPSLRGGHQIDNAGLAIAAARSLQLSENAIEKGLLSAEWPARLQALTRGPLYDAAQKAGAEIWLDGGHNPHAGRAIAEAMAEMDPSGERPLYLIMGMLANKDAPGFLDAFTGLASGVISVSVPGHASLSAETLADIVRTRDMVSGAADTPLDALHLVIEKSDAPPRVLVCGSLYLAGTVLAENG